MKLTIPGDPIAQMRPRFRRVGAHVMTYNPQNIQKGVVTTLLSMQMNENSFKPITDRSISLNVTFFIPIPDSATLTHRNAKLWQLDNLHKPDLDNLIKFLLDCSNDVLWHDDCQITSITAKKQYTDNPRTEIEIMEVYMPKHITDILRNISPIETVEMLRHCDKLGSFQQLSPESMQHLAECLHEFCKKYHKTISKIAKVPCDKP